MISVIRFYIFWKTEHHKIVNPTYILIMTFGVLIAHYIFKSMLAFLSIGSNGLFDKCIGLEKGPNHVYIIVSAIYNVLTIFVGVITDSKMYWHLKKKEESHISSLVA